MADKTNIEWTEATWNPVTGCSKVSAGCKHCYAERDWVRLSANPHTRYHGRGFTDVQCHGDVLELPLRWKRPRRIFVNSMSDLFHESVPDLFIADVFGVMAAAPQHTYQVLTKRPERAAWLLGGKGILSFAAAVAECAALYSDVDIEWPLQNVWLGVSIEDQATADERIPILLQTPAWIRWVSAEPLLGPVDISGYLDGTVVHADITRPNVDWVVAGGESGPNARPMHPDWARSLRHQCVEACVPFLFKQWGEWFPSAYLPKDTALPAHRWGWISEKGGPAEISHYGPFKDEFAHHELMGRVGKKVAGRRLDNILHDDYPTEVPF